MKHLIVTLMIAVLSVCGARAERVWVQVASVEELAAATQFKIYPCEKVEDGTLMCSNAATSYGLTKSPDGSSEGALWTLEKAEGSAGYYIKNELGYYWPKGERSSTATLTCTNNKDNAQIVFVSYYDGKGFTFRNESTSYVLNNLHAVNSQYNWWTWFDNQGNYSDRNNFFVAYAEQEYALPASASAVNLNLGNIMLWANMNVGASEVTDLGTAASASNAMKSAQEWGRSWTIPSADQLKKLCSNACWVWTTDYNPNGTSTYTSGFVAFTPNVEGDKGKVLSSMKSGSYTYNVNSDTHIFLPVSGAEGTATYAGDGAYLQLAGGSSPSVSVTSSATSTMYVRPIVDVSKMGVGSKVARKFDSNTRTLFTGWVYEVDGNFEINGANASEAPLTIKGEGAVVLDFKNGSRITANALAASRQPGIYMTSRNQYLVLTGTGELIANGGNGEKHYQKGACGEKATEQNPGKGGNGGQGGDGCAPGIGGLAGAGGAGGAGGDDIWTHVASNGTDGTDGTSSGHVIIMDNVKVTTESGATDLQAPVYQATAGLDRYVYHGGALTCHFDQGGGGGGNGGIGGTPTYSLCGGAGGGGGGGGGGIRGWRCWAGAHTTVVDDANTKRGIQESENVYHTRSDRAGKNGCGGGAGGSHVQATTPQNGKARRICYIDRKNNSSTANGDYDNGGQFDWTGTDGGKKGNNGADGKVYILSSLASLGSTTTCQQESWEESDFRNKLTVAMQGNSASERSDMLGYLIHSISVNKETTNGKNVTFKAYGKEYTNTFECFNGMAVPETFSASVPEDNSDNFDGYYIKWRDVSFKAFDANGSVTSDFWKYLSKVVNGKRCFDFYDNLTLSARYTDQTSLTVCHCVLPANVKDYSDASFKNYIAYCETSIRTVASGGSASFDIHPFQTLGGSSITTVDGLVLLESMYRLSSSSPISAATTRVVNALQNDTAYIYYLPRESKYTLNSSKLSAYGASFAGTPGVDYTADNADIGMGDAIKLPRIEFKTAGTDGIHYIHSGWLTSRGDTVQADVRITYMPLGEFSVEPLFTESALVILTALDGDEFGRGDNKQTVNTATSSLLLYNEGAATKETSMLIMGSENIDKVYVYVKHPAGTKVKKVVAQMTNVVSGEPLRTIEVVNADKADTAGECYFNIPDDWTKGYDEEAPVIYVTATIGKKAGTIIVNDKAQSPQFAKASAVNASVPANTVVTAVTVDNKNFYTDDEYFKDLLPKYDVEVAGSLDEFEFYAGDIVYIYNKVLNSDNQSSVKITLTPVEGSAISELELWASQYKTTEIFNGKDTQDTITYNAFYALDAEDVLLDAKLETTAADLAVENYQPDVKIAKVYADDYDITAKVKKLDAVATYDDMQGTAYTIPGYDEQIVSIRVEGDSLPETSLMTVSYTYEDVEYTDTLSYLNGNDLIYYDQETGEEISLGNQIAGYWLILSKDVPMTVRIVSSEPTAVENIAAEGSQQGKDADAPRYDIGGRRVSSNYKGVVIMHGKKIIIK
jgi:hypothetical protein